MNVASDALYSSFRIETENSCATIVPIRHVHRSAVSSSDLTLFHLFESKNEALAVLRQTDTLLFAHFQEIDSHTKRIVCIERLDPKLFALLQTSTLNISVSHVLTLPEVRTVKAARQVELVDFSKPDWWKVYDHDIESNNVPSNSAFELLLDLGPRLNRKVSIPEAADSFDDILSSLVPLYYDTLYVSKASLAFFAKSTLPRLRARIEEKGYSLIQYADYVQSQVIPCLADLDNKYKLIIPEHVRKNWEELNTLLEETQEESESSYISRWLVSCTTETNFREPESVLTKHLLPLKCREYQLIILLLLETMTISPNNDSTVARIAGLSFASTETSELVVDILIDRLGISQSLDFTRSDDQLKLFCLEVINPFYATRLPDLTQSIQQKCVPAEYLTHEIPPTPAKSLKFNATKDRDKSRIPLSGSNSATLKRTRSAPANLLSAEKIAQRKPSLGREVSMTKRAPTIDTKVRVSQPAKKIISFEERRRKKIDKEEQERIQVGQTPAKRRHFFLPTEASAGVQVLEIPEKSKASFMAIGETPSKTQRLTEPVSTEIPGSSNRTPLRVRGQVTEAPADGIQDTPSGNSILFKLNSPSRLSAERHQSRELFPPRSSLDLMSSPELMRTDHRLPKLKKSVTFSGTEHLNSGPRNLFGSFIERSSDISGRSENMEDDGLFGEQITNEKSRVSAIGTKSTSLKSSALVQDPSIINDVTGSPTIPLSKQQTLEDALDWL